MTSVWKMGKTLEWYTEFPFDNYPRESPTFFIQNVECYFHVCRKYRGYQDNICNGYYYEIYLKLKMTQCQLNSFWLVIYSDFCNPNNFARSNVKFFTSDKHLHRVPEEHISNRKTTLGSGNFVRFVFVFKMEDKLSLGLENNRTDKSTEANLLSLRADLDELSLDLGEILKKGDHTDVQLLCNGGNIPAHRAILAARSKVFSDMLQQSTEESKSGLINFITTEKSVMELCMEFIYKGKILNLPIEKATDLYVLAHVLNIPSLVKLCTDLMISNLHDDNYISYLVLADKYNDYYFKGGLIDYISNNAALLKMKAG